MAIRSRRIALRQSTKTVFSRALGLSSLALVLVTVSGCNVLQSEVNHGYSQSGSWEGGVVYTTAEIRIVTQRKHPMTNQVVTCTEPTADVAKALSTVAQASLQGGAGAASGGLGVGGGSSEAVAELAGRSTALLALRDGLFRACEAYLNGAIGSDAYALVLSRYGQLMTTLFLGEDIQQAARAPQASVSSPPPPTINLQVTPPSTTSSSTGDSKTTDKSATKKASTSLTALTTSELLKVAQTIPSGQQTAADKAGNGATSATTADGGAAAGTADATGAAPAQAAKEKPKPKPAPAPAPAPAPGGGNSPPAKTPSDPGADLVQLNGQYFGLDQNLTGQLVVACVNEYDPTRVRQWVSSANGGPPGGTPGQNAWLRQICGSITSLDTVQSLQKKSVTPLPPEKSAAPAPAPVPAPPKKSGDVQSGT